MLQKQSFTEFFDDISLIDHPNIENYLMQNIEKDSFSFQPLDCFNNQNKIDSILIIQQSQKEPQINNQYSSVKRNINNQGIYQYEIDNLLLSQQKQKYQENVQLIEKQKINTEKGKTYAKNYRQRKKQQVKYLQQQNRFLKQKIQDLSFRLKQAQVQLNKLKNNNSQVSLNFQNTKQNYLHQIQKAVYDENIELQKLLQMQQKFKIVSQFSSKHKMDLLNYFMSELLENLINDMDFYFVDSFIQKRGFWRQSQSIPYRKIDQEIVMVYGKFYIDQYKNEAILIKDHMQNMMSKFKGLWNKLYHDYLQIIKQGSLLERLFQPIQQRLRNLDVKTKILNNLRLGLYFEKIKYRKDMRLLRQSWFKQFEKQEQIKQDCKRMKKIKKISS